MQSKTIATNLQLNAGALDAIYRQPGNSTRTLGLLSRLSRTTTSAKMAAGFLTRYRGFGAAAMAITDQKSPQLLQPSWTRWITHRHFSTHTQVQPRWRRA